MGIRFQMNVPDCLPLSRSESADVGTLFKLTPDPDPAPLHSRVLLDDAGWPEGAGALATAGQSLSATPILTGGGRKHCPFALANPAGPELQGPPPRLRGNGYWRSLRGAVTGPYCERQNLKMRRVAQLTRRIGIAPGGKHRHTTLVACFAGEHAKGGRWNISAGTLMARRPT